MTTKIWLNPHYYIPVDNEGFVQSKWSEGTLGIVLELLHGGNKPRRAIKIPRLVADTMKENAYISAILEEEERNASDAGSDVRFADSLLRLTDPDGNLFRGEKATFGSPYPVMDPEIRTS